METTRSCLIGRGAALAFDVIEAAEHYPAFLPWCSDVAILSRDSDVVVARIGVHYRGVRFAFTTRNPKRRPHWMAVRLEEGPFRRFEGEWQLTELSPRACKIQFTLNYEFDSRILGKFAETVFDGIAGSLVDAFARRVEQTPEPPAPGPDQPTTPGAIS
jgi:ribosome-associated toxin RatA of RatAB toxin-antitoxin module